MTVWTIRSDMRLMESNLERASDISSPRLSLSKMISKSNKLTKSTQAEPMTNQKEVLEVCLNSEI